MDRIVKLAVLGAIVWGAFTYGKPMLERLEATGGGSFSTTTSAGSGDGSCVREVRDAYDGFASSVSGAVRSQDAWRDLQDVTLRQVANAQRSCFCQEPSCEQGARALDEMQSWIREIDSEVSNGQPVLNLARGAERVNSAIEAAEGR